MPRRLASAAASLLGALVALVVAHDLVFLASERGEYAALLAATGHDSTWTTTVLLVTGLSAALLVGGTWRLVELRAAAGTRGAAGRRGPHGRAILHRAIPLATRIGLVVTVAFAIQENVEHAVGGLPLPGLAILVTAAGVLPLPIIAAASLAVAFVVVLFRWRRDALLARIAGRRPVHAAAGRGGAPPPAAPRPRPASLLARGRALRAPPAFVPA
jgi:hypothetical protein